MITRSTNHMISTRDHSHDLVIWSRHVTYELHLDIKASLISISASPFILTSNHHWFPTSASCLRPGLIHHRSTHLYPIVDLEKVLGVLTSRSQWWWRERGLPRSLLMKATRGLTSRSTPIQDPVVVVWEGFTSIAIHWWEPRWVVSSTASWTQLKPDPRGRQHQLQPFHRSTRWVGVRAVADKRWAW